MRRHPRYLPALASVALTLVASFSTNPAAARVVAMGDVHGAYEPLLAILREADLVDRQGRWTGGDATLVQVGDFLDRGTQVFEVMDLLMRLQEEAPGQGGEVIVLLGNHEAMNLLGVTRDVSRKLYAELAGPGSEARQEALYRAAAELYRSRARGSAPPPGFEEQWKRKHPPGFVEYCDLLKPEGKYGRWLRTLPVAVKLDDMLFMHAGLSPEMGAFDAEAVTEWVHEDVERHDDYRRLLLSHGLILPVTSYQELVETAEDLAGGSVALASLEKAKAEVRKASREFLRHKESWTLTNLYGPLWFRGFAKWNRGEGLRNVKTLGRALGVEHFIVGHSPVRDRAIHHRFGGAIFLTDTGMLSEHYRGGRAAVLERVGERWTAIYRDSREVLLGPGTRHALARGWQGPDGKSLPLRSDEEALEFLAKADAVSSRVLEGGTSRTLKVLLERGGVRAHAAFRTVNLKKSRVTLGKEVYLDFHDSYRYEVAAYKLSRLLGLDHIPPVVERVLAGERGSLQLWVEGAMTESDRNREKIEPPDWTAWYRQLQIMRIFDRLIFNYDRNRGNILIGEDWKLWMIDHTRSFRTSTEVPGIATMTHCEKDLWRRIRELEESEVRKHLAPQVSARQVKALMKRRDKVVRRVEELVEEYGEEHVIFDLEEAPSPVELGHLADAEIEGFLDDLPDESVVPDELLGAAAPE